MKPTRTCLVLAGVLRAALPAFGQGSPRRRCAAGHHAEDAALPAPR